MHFVEVQAHVREGASVPRVTVCIVNRAEQRFWSSIHCLSYSAVWHARKRLLRGAIHGTHLKINASRRQHIVEWARTCVSQRTLALLIYPRALLDP